MCKAAARRPKERDPRLGGESAFKAKGQETRHSLRPHPEWLSAEFSVQRPSMPIPGIGKSLKHWENTVPEREHHSQPEETNLGKMEELAQDWRFRQEGNTLSRPREARTRLQAQDHQ